MLEEHERAGLAGQFIEALLQVPVLCCRCLLYTSPTPHPQASGIPGPFFYFPSRCPRRPQLSFPGSRSPKDSLLNLPEM